MTPSQKMNELSKLKRIKVIDFSDSISEETIQRLKEIDDNIRQAWINKDKFYCD